MKVGKLIRRAFHRDADRSIGEVIAEARRITESQAKAIDHNAYGPNSGANADLRYASGNDGLTP